jgi:sugar phosphate permease
MEGPQLRRSFGRWYILGLISLMYLITYLDRVNISTAAPVISKEFGFDKVTMGIIFSAFVWAYALFQVPGGWLNDRFGPRRVLAIIVAYWSVMTAATAAATVAVVEAPYAAFIGWQGSAQRHADAVIVRRQVDLALAVPLAKFQQPAGAIDS